LGFTLAGFGADKKIKGGTLEEATCRRLTSSVAFVFLRYARTMTRWNIYQSTSRLRRQWRNIGQLEAKDRTAIDKYC
jgi:hypothetical protein